MIIPGDSAFQQLTYKFVYRSSYSTTPMGNSAFEDIKKVTAPHLCVKNSTEKIPHSRKLRISIRRDALHERFVKKLRRYWRLPYAVELKKTFERQGNRKKFRDIADYITKSGNPRLRQET